MENPYQAGEFADYQGQEDQAYQQVLTLASPMSRFGGNMLDGIILSIPIYVVIFVAVIIGGETNEDLAVLVGAGLSLVYFFIWLGITLHLVKTNAQSIGKKLLGMKVVRPNGENASVSQIVLKRNLLVIAISFIPILGGLFSIVDALMIFSENHRMLHDRIADTLVVEA